MTDDLPPETASKAPRPWPEPPGCPSCKAPNHRGASTCWLCGAELPVQITERIEPAPIATTPEAPDKARPSWPRPRFTIGSTMVGIGVVGVFLAVGQGRAGVIAGLVVIVGPSVGYLIVRARRIGRVGDDEQPSSIERALGEISATALVLSGAAAAIAVVVILALRLVEAVVNSL